LQIINYGRSRTEKTPSVLIPKAKKINIQIFVCFSFFPLAKFAFDFGRLPLHWPVAKFLLKTLGYKELLNYHQRDIMAALRIWMIEDTHQVLIFLTSIISNHFFLV
jgi:hypothetical protein